MNYAAAAKGNKGRSARASADSVTATETRGATATALPAAQAKEPTAKAPVAQAKGPTVHAPAPAWGATAKAPAAAQAKGPTADTPSPAPAPAWGATAKAPAAQVKGPTAPAPAPAWGATAKAPAAPAWGATQAKAPAAPAWGAAQAKGPAEVPKGPTTATKAPVTKDQAAAATLGSGPSVNYASAAAKGKSAVPSKQSKPRTAKPSFVCLKCGSIDQSDLTDGCVVTLPKKDGKGCLYVRGEWDGRGTVDLKRTDGGIAVVHDERFLSCFDESEVMFVFRGIYCDGDVANGEGRARYCAPKSATIRSTFDLHDVHPDSIWCEPDADGNYLQQQKSTCLFSRDQEQDDEKKGQDENDPLSAVLAFQSWKNQY